MKMNTMYINTPTFTQSGCLDYGKRNCNGKRKLQEFPTDDEHKEFKRELEEEMKNYEICV
jgi:predicted DNA-binding WGR domain protein